MEAKIHKYTSQEPMLKVNAFIVETSKELVIVDTTLTMSDSKALRQMAESFGKPISGIILTHGHPDHVAGTFNLSRPDIPIYAVPAVKKLMENTEDSKHREWSAVFGSEWIPKWIYPNELVKHNDTVKISGLNFTVLDIGSGGDSDANSLWLLDDENSTAFLGDFIYNHNHAYMNDGSILRWLANLDCYSPVLKNFKTYCIGHGPSCDVNAISRQKEYFLTYCSQVLKHTNGTGIFNEETRKMFEQFILEKFPDYGCQFMVMLSADRVGKELLSLS